MAFLWAARITWVELNVVLTRQGKLAGLEVWETTGGLCPVLHAHANLSDGCATLRKLCVEQALSLSGGIGVDYICRGMT